MPLPDASATAAVDDGKPCLAPPYGRWTALLVAGSVLFRLALCASFELVGDEAYYWLWSRDLSWCYYSKGPGVAAAIRLGTWIAGDTELGVRLVSVLLGAGTAWGIYSLARRLFSARAGFWSVVVVSLTPIYFAGGLLMTTDPISVFFWVWAARLFVGMASGASLSRWAAVGVLIGLGMLGKFTSVAQLACFALYLAWTPEGRVQFRRPGFWIMAAAALLALLPVLHWNVEHDWITFRHLRQRGAMDRPWSFSLPDLLEFLGLQAAVYFPPFVAGAVAAFAGSRAWRRGHADTYRYLASLTIPLLVFYTVLATHDAGQPNWTVAASPSALILLTARALDWTRESARLRRLAAGTLIAAAAVSVLLAAAVHIRLPGRDDPLRRIRGARTLAAATEAFRKDQAASFVLASDYQVASLLSFYMPGRPRVYFPRGDRVRNQFAFWPGYENMPAGSHAVLVAKEPRFPPTLLDEFRRLGKPWEVVTTWRGHRVRSFYLHLCRDFKSATEPATPAAE